MHHIPPFVLLLLPFSGLLPAQAATVSVRAASVLSASAQAGQALVTRTLPIGPLPAVGNVDAFSALGVTVAETSTSWGATADTTLAGCVVKQHLIVNGSAGGSCASGPNDIVIGIACPVQRPALLNLRMLKAASPDVPSTTVVVDVGNHGAMVFTGANPVNGTTIPVSIGPQPFEVLVHFAGAFVAGSSSVATVADDTVVLEVTPDNRLGVLPAALGCTNNSATLRATWDLDGVLFDLDASGSQPPPLAVAVFGLAAAPALLPHASVTLPCLLLPTPDLVVVLPPGGLLLPLPPAVRPVTLWAQGVLIDAAGLGTSNGFFLRTI